jgi:predicted dehydrogenase/nucleoside-diphosphate-sugar epimerase
LVGFLGAGYILDAHAKALLGVEDVALHVVCDTSMARARSAAERFGIPQVTTTLEELIASGCDAVHVLLPPAFHASAAERLLRAGKHVLIEKPMALSVADCASLTELARERNLRLGINHNFLFSRAYEDIRKAQSQGLLGDIDHLTVNWLHALPLLEAGPFDSWMIEQPQNLIFELGCHLAAFAIDLVGSPQDVLVSFGNPVDLPGGKRVYRNIDVIGRLERASIVLSLAVSSGRADRSLRMRGAGGVAQLDYERGLAWVERAGHANPIIDNFRTARSIGTAIALRAHQDFARYVKATLVKAPGANPFEESIARSVSAFYRDWGGELDKRLSGEFGTRVIALCEKVASQLPAHLATAEASSPLTASTSPKILVVGGTGFIGRRLVQKLITQGQSVRVLTRNAAAARAIFGGMQVELRQGSHGSETDLRDALHGIDVVYHLAKTEGASWEDYVQNDIEPTRRLAAAAIEAGVKRFIYTGTIDSYASARSNDVITSDTPIDPKIDSRNFYARSKAQCETLLKDLHQTGGLPLVIFRPGIVIGKGSPTAHWGVGRFNSASDVEFWGGGSHPLPFVTVDDVADALVLGAETPGIDGETFLLTDGPLLTAREYTEEVAARSRTRINARPRQIWKFFAEDLFKEAIKNFIRHPGRRRPSYHDWSCRSQRARYDSGKTRKVLGWTPAGNRQALIQRGIHAAVDERMR